MSGLMELKPEELVLLQPEPVTTQMAREMVRLDREILLAASGQRWLDAQDLAWTREIVAGTRSVIMRRQWAER